MGMCEYRITTEDTVRVVYVYELQLHESLRGHGIGQAMLAEAEAAGRARRAKGMMLLVHTANHAARRFYARWGLSHSPTSPDRCASDPTRFRCLPSRCVRCGMRRGCAS